MKLFEAGELKEPLSYNLGPKHWNLRQGVGTDKIRDQVRTPVQRVTKYTGLGLQGNIQVTDKDLGLLYSVCVLGLRC